MTFDEMFGNLPVETRNKIRLYAHAMSDTGYETGLRESVDGLSISYICASCGGFAYVPVAKFTSFDSGTTLTCDTCGGETIIELHSREHYKQNNLLLIYERALKRIAVCRDNPDPLGYLPVLAQEALDSKIKTE